MINSHVARLPGFTALLCCTLLLSGCGKDELAERKKACADFVKYRVLKESDTQRCSGEEGVFRKAASELVAADLQQLYPAMVDDAKTVSAYAKNDDLASYPALPLHIENPIFVDGSDPIAKSWPATVDLVQVTFDPPSDTNRQWQISGYRAGNPEDTWVLNLDGFGPNESSRIENNCALLSYSSASSGCRARVFIKATSGTDDDLRNLVAVAIELTPPSREEAFQALLENEMIRWRPINGNQ
ncbi:hypothetical protein Rleg9DRAFT_3674 [Rhizobium leguminosarum bv. trifolii WSM597]|uniref:Uncharacterized protein n=1 Tax=Rhizobium leguminosarum bv. trifolii WSM597 TaxID=754764 RepID=J0H464_RHILT|nr:hypothetical protein [Rhizobium leguminosarum]EJB04815.1 hypothetical protein Rleg9DRAFT_3674 [Rhizobium leguminosarum bv. trifolii WSM597]